MLYSIKERSGFIESKMGIYKVSISHRSGSIVVGVIFRGLLTAHPDIITASVPVSNENINLDSVAYYIFFQIHNRLTQGYFLSEKELEEIIKSSLELSKS